MPKRRAEGAPVQLVEPGQPEDCAEFQEAIDLLNQALAGVPPIDLFGLGPLLRANKDAVLAAAKAAGCFPVDQPASFFQPLIDGLAAGIGAGIGAIGPAVGGIFDALTPAVKGLADLVVDLMDRAGMGDLSANIDRTGDFFAFLGSLQDVIVDEAALTTGPLTFAQLLAYENRISGIRTVVVLVSYAWSIVKETVTLGQVEGDVGLLIHLIDDAVGDVAKVVSTQLIRRAIADPLADGFKEIHRTVGVSPAEASRAYELGLVDDGELVAMLAREGVSDRAIQLKVGLARVAFLERRGVGMKRTRLPSAGQLDAMAREGVISEDEYVRGLGRLGYEEDDRARLLALSRTRRKPPPEPEEEA